MDRTQYRELLTDVAKKGHEIVMQMNNRSNDVEADTRSLIITTDVESDSEKLDSISRFIDALKAAETSIVDPMNPIARRE